MNETSSINCFERSGIVEKGYIKNHVHTNLLWWSQGSNQTEGPTPPPLIVANDNSLHSNNSNQSWSSRAARETYQINCLHMKNITSK